MKSIQNPSAGKLCLILVPILIVELIAIIFNIYTFKWWMTAICIASFLGFAIPFTYYCIKQKCYYQLIYTWVLIVIWGITIFYGNYYAMKAFS